MNWKDMSDSSEDEWFDQELLKKDPKPKEPQEAKPTAKVTDSAKLTTKHTYLKDEQILLKLQSKQISETKTIKVVKCLTPEAREIIEKLKLKNKKEYAEGNFILNFFSEEDLLEFVREKIEKRYKFFLSPFIRYDTDQKGKPQGERPNAYPRRESDNKHPEQPRNYVQKKGRVNPPQEPSKRSYEPKQEEKQQLSFQLYENRVIISSRQFSIKQILQKLKQNKVAKQFSKLRIICPASLIDKVYQLCADIHADSGFGLLEESQANEPDQLQLVLSEKASGAKVNALVKKLQLVRVEQDEERHLNAQKENYFKYIERGNKNVLEKGFSISDYTNLFKSEFSNIAKNWKQWIIRAEGEQIEHLLKLSYRLKKGFDLEAQIKVGMTELLPFAVLELGAFDEKGKCPRIDTFAVNSYLSSN